MILEFQKRPFGRPLVVWITGILLCLYFTAGFLTVAFLSIPVVLLLLSLCFSSGAELSFSYRWVWGFVFLLMLLSLAVIVTDYSGRRTNSEPGPLTLQSAALQQQLASKVSDLNLTDEEKSVFATLTLGYRQSMDSEVRKRFSLTGVSHILSVSGFHVGVVCGFVLFLFRLFPNHITTRWIRYILTMLLLWSYVFVTGLAVPSVRAGIMLSLYLTSQVVRRTGDRYNTLAAAAFCMLAYNPFYLFEIGFQLSFVAVFFILYLQPRLNALIPLRNPLLKYPWDVITVTLAAQVGTTFLCLYYFGQFSLVFLFTNLPLSLLATLQIPLGLVWLILPAWFPGYQWLQLEIEWLTHSMVYIVDLFSSIPGASVYIRFDWLDATICYTALFLFLGYLFKPRPRILLACLLFILIFLLKTLFNSLVL